MVYLNPSPIIVYKEMEVTRGLFGGLLRGLEEPARVPGLHGAAGWPSSPLGRPEPRRESVPDRAWKCTRLGMASRKGPFGHLKRTPFLSCGDHRDMAGRSGGYPGSAWRLTVDTSFTPRLADWANAAGHRRHPHLPSSESVWILTAALVRAPRRAAIPQPAAATTATAAAPN